MDQPTHRAATTVPTRLGHLHVQTIGAGPPAVLWHSLFVDSTTWTRVQQPLAGMRRLVLVDGPAHGHNPPVPHRFTLEDCVGAAADVLDRRGMHAAIGWLSLARPDLTPVLDRLGTPTLLTTGQNDPMWTAANARAAAAHLANGALVILPGAGHVGPLLQAAPAVVDLVTAFWRDPAATVARHRGATTSTFRPPAA